MIDSPIEVFTTERPGNECLLKYKLLLGYDWGDLSLALLEHSDSWQGSNRDSRSFLFKEYSEIVICEKIQEYVDGFTIDNAEKYRILERIQYILSELNITIKLINYDNT